MAEIVEAVPMKLLNMPQAARLVQRVPYYMTS